MDEPGQAEQFELTELYCETDIAIVGMALRAPGARNIREFWANLASGTSSIRRLSVEELEASGETAARYSQTNYVPFAADLPDMEMFDAEFFGLSPKEAAIMDPQHRHFLECAWEAMEDAARPPESIAGPVGVFAGCGMGSYFYFNVCSRRELVDQVGMFLLRHTGNDKDFLSTRASYTFNLQGPSVNVQTACSTSLVAVHYACQSLLSRECDMALAGGVTIELPHRRGYLYADGEILSPDGCCRAFDHRAAGTVFGSGVGVVALRRLTDALADGDPIHAVIKGTAVNNDGRAKAGYLAPSVDGQAKAILEAQGLAGVAADRIGYVECHGTGTYLGDPIEIEALTQAFRQSTDRAGFCRVGSVKTNIGHLDTAAGVVGLIKTALALEHGAIPATLGFEAPNPSIDFASSPFVVNDQLTPWPAAEAPRFAAVNSLGVGGTNAHAILQEAPAREPNPAAEAPDGRPKLIVLSARSRKALDAASRSLAAEIEQLPAEALPNVAHTLFVGRRHFEQRRVLAARDGAEAAALLGGADPRRVYAHTPVEGASGAVFLFPGGGAQHPGMAKRLYAEDARFRASVDEGLSYLPADAAVEIHDLWLGAGSEDSEAAHRLLLPSRQLPAILIVEVAMARLWMDRGVRPTGLIGHSMGENAAACVAGVLSFRDAVNLVRLRGELFDTVKGGGMLSVVLGAAALKSRLPADLDVASVNAPELCVASGPVAALEEFQQTLEAEGVEAVRVAIDIAAHSRMLEPILQRFEGFLRTIELHAPKIPIVSNLTGSWLSEQDARDPSYWARHLRSTVRFADGIATLAEDRSRVYIEVGPGKTLSSLVKAQGLVDPNAVLNSLPHAEEAGSDDHVHFVAALGRAWATGIEIDVAGVLAGAESKRLRLPTYPFQHGRYFLDRVSPTGEQMADSLARRPDPVAWGYRPVWKKAASPGTAEPDTTRRTWLVFLDDAGLGNRVVEQLRARGDAVATVQVADQFNRRGGGDYALCPEAGRPGYDALVSALAMDALTPDRILHLWLLTADESFRPGSSFFHRNQERGFFSLFFLAQAFGEASLEGSAHFTVVTNGMQRIGDRLVLHPDKATVTGPARVIPKEFPGVTVRMVDLELPAAAPRSIARDLRRRLAASLDADAGRAVAPSDLVLDLLWEDLLATPETETVAYHAGRRWTQDFETAPLDRADDGAARFRTRGVYLVTGGAGDLSISICEELARRFQARLALVGRTRLPDRPFWPGYLRLHGSRSHVGRTIAAIERLEALGAETVYISGDVSNPDDVRAAVARAESELGPINGVIHAAGTVDDDLIPLKNVESIEAVLAPKVHGAANLAEALKDARLDLFLLFSSTSVATAPTGQVDYVAANAYLNAFADSQAGRSDRSTVAIQWGVWAEVGLAARAIRDEPEDDQQSGEERGAVGPLFDRWTTHGGRRALEGRQGPETSWLLNEHRLATGEAIWPGTGYLEIAAQVMREHGVEGPFEVEDLEFLRPLHVHDGKTRIVRAVTEPAKAGLALEVVSADPDGDRDAFVLHAQARLNGAPAPCATAIDVSAIARRCGAARSAPAGGAMKAAQEAHLVFGPRWSVLRSLALGEREALATLELDPASAADAEDGYRLHAGLLDIATGYAMELVEGYDAAESLWAPISYSRARVYRETPRRVFSWVRLSDGRQAADGYASFDVTLFDEDENVVFEADRLLVKRLGRKINLAEAGAVRARSGSSDRGARKSRSGAAAALTEQVAQGIRPTEGADAMFRAIATGSSQVIVSSMDLRALQRRAAGPPPPPAASTSFERPDLDSEFVAPSTEVEKRLAGFWSELLGVEKIGVHDDFFELGGHSLIAVRLFRMIREAFSVDLPISALFEASTIAQCAGLVGDVDGTETGEADTDAPRGAASKPSFLHVVPMFGAERRNETPFFLCAGMFGNVLNLRHLALMVGADRPVYGLQARGLYGDHAPHETFEDMARDYCTELRQVQPRGPYLLGGFSGGGLTAYAMAQQLAAEGEEISLLALLDTPLPRQTALSYRDLTAMKLQDIERQGGAFFKNWAVKRARWEARRLMGRFNAPDAVSSEQFHDSVIEAAFYRALSRFEVHSYSGKIALFRPKLEVAYRLSGGRRLDSNRYLLLEDNGWGGYADDLTVVEVPGDHDGMVLEPNVRVLAGRLRSLLSAADIVESKLFAAE